MKRSPTTRTRHAVSSRAEATPLTKPIVPRNRTAGPDRRLFSDRRARRRGRSGGGGPAVQPALLPDPPLTALIDELRTRSPVFRDVWAHHEGRTHHTGLQELHHPVMGDLTLAFEVLDVQADQGLSIIVYSAGSDTSAAIKLAHLSRWAAGTGETSTSNAEAVRT
ncbi:MmyB family transcriptional regulator [Streptomyces sp. 2A115]|uniref:MmyB family transcriptional regulator n=1 Tax=Streptomyces sp. 2A115 TaxID=3457439 RepID=UPI003FD32EA6